MPFELPFQRMPSMNMLLLPFEIEGAEPCKVPFSQFVPFPYLRFRGSLDLGAEMIARPSAQATADLRRTGLPTHPVSTVKTDPRVAAHCGLTFDVRGWPQASPLDGGVRPQLGHATVRGARPAITHFG
jgi:hypothetical protein